MNRWLLSLVCLPFFFTSAAKADDQPKPSQSAATNQLPFRLTSGYLLQVEGRIGNQTHLKFILDTGASISIVDRKIAETLKLNAETKKSFNFDRELKWDSATLPEVQFGPIRAANVAVLVGDLASYSTFAKKADAILGMDLLKLSNVTIDFDAGTLNFDSVAPRPYVAGGDPLASSLIVEVQVQNRPVHLLVDTGSPGILFYEERLRKRVPGLRTAGSIRNATMSGRTQVKQAILPDVVMGKRNRDVAVAFLPSPVAEVLSGIDGIAGIAALEAHRVHLDFVSKTISWE